MTVTAINLELALQLPLLQYWVQDTKLAHCVPVLKAGIEEEYKKL